MSESWTSYSLLGITGVRPGRKDESRGRGLIVMVDPQNLAVFAFESLADDFGGVTFQAVFDDHSHHVVLERAQSLTHAIGAAEDYMRRWRSGKLKPHERCGCDEITLSTTAGALRKLTKRGRGVPGPPYIVSDKRCPVCKAPPKHLCKSGCQGRINSDGKGS